MLAARALSPTARELTLERGDLPFRAGQLLLIHGRSLLEERSYTICSGEHDPHLQVLYRSIPGGRLTPWLDKRGVGESIDISAPYGEFTIRDPARPLVFIATGTGIAPARAYHRTHPALDLTVIHGVREAGDLFYRDEFDPVRYAPCLSGPPLPGCFAGRVTDYCATRTFPPTAHYYLCGSNAMFYDIRDLLTKRGVPPDAIHTEAYYYHAED